MNYGLYLSASGVLTNMARQDVFANNLANVSTSGFRKDLAAVRQRQPEALEDNMRMNVRHDLLDKLGGGALFGPQQISMQPGPVDKATRHDAALRDDDAYFVVGQVNRETGQTDIRLTRDGRFTRNADGYLVTTAGGHQVLGPNDFPIRLAPDAEFSFTDDGSVRQNDETVGQIQVAAVRDIKQLVKKGGNLLGFASDADSRETLTGAVMRPGYLEASNVDPVNALMELISATKAVSANGNLIRYHDLLMDRAVNVLGRVA